MPSSPATAISVLIRTFNSGKTLERVLAALPLEEGDEFVVIDSGSTDATLAIARQRGVRVIRPSGPFNYSKSLNVGFAAARNPWVLVLSSHCIPASAGMLSLLRQTASEAAAPVAVIYGETGLCKPRDVAAAPDCIDQAHWERNQTQPGGNGVALYRRACWAEHPFVEDLVTAEDLEWFLWAMRRGYRALRVPQAWALYRNQGSLRHMFRKGWFEQINAATLVNAQGPDLSQAAHFRNLLINAGSLVKKVFLGRIPPGTGLRQMAHALGGYLASARSARRG
jgi:glycosyltransferase involved in cell wall biosynthesis